MIRWCTLFVTYSPELSQCIVCVPISGSFHFTDTSLWYIDTLRSSVQFNVRLLFNVNTHEQKSSNRQVSRYLSLSFQFTFISTHGKPFILIRTLLHWTLFLSPFFERNTFEDDGKLFATINTMSLRKLTAKYCEENNKKKREITL